MAADLLHATRERVRPGLARVAELLVDELDRFESLLADLLEISRFDAGVAELDAEPIDLRAGRAPRGRRGCAPLADAGRRRDRAATCRSTPVIAEVDARRVERILRNLVGNAVEHGEGRPVEVDAAPRDDDAVAVTVRDHGVGLQARRGGAGVQPVLAGRPVPRPADRRHRPGPVDRAGGRPAARRLAGGVGRAAATARSSGSPCRAGSATS